MRCQPRAREHERSPPRIGGQHERRGQAADQLDQPSCDEVHRDEQRRTGHTEVEVARDREIEVSFGILKVTHPRRADARLGQSIVEPRRGAVAEVGSQGLVNRRQDLQQDEHDTDQGERAAKTVALLHGADECSHRDRESRRQHASQHEDDPQRDANVASAFGSVERTSTRYVRATGLAQADGLPRESHRSRESCQSIPGVGHGEEKIGLAPFRVEFGFVGASAATS